MPSAQAAANSAYYKPIANKKKEKRRKEKKPLNLLISKYINNYICINLKYCIKIYEIIARRKPGNLPWAGDVCQLSVALLGKPAKAVLFAGMHWRTVWRLYLSFPFCLLLCSQARLLIRLVGVHTFWWEISAHPLLLRSFVPLILEVSSTRGGASSSAVYFIRLRYTK